jgi:hypothetical protein
MLVDIVYALPLSLSVDLGMVLVGAQGATRP